MFGIGLPEMLLILAIALIIIGPKKLPDIAKSLGRALGEFKKATGDLKESVGLNKDFRDVKKAFKDINQDVKDSILASTSETEKPTAFQQEPADSPPPNPDENRSAEQATTKKETPPEDPTSEIQQNDKGPDTPEGSAPETESHK